MRYLGGASIVVDAAELEQAVDRFLGIVLDRLREEKVGATNVHAIWARLQIERTEPARAE